MSWPEIILPPRNARKPKRIKVRIITAHPGWRYGVKQRTLTYHIYGPRPKRGDKVRIAGGVFFGRHAEVAWRHSFFRGETYLVERSYPKGWT